MMTESPVLKARISQLIALGRGFTRINNICTLVYYTNDELGRSCDNMTLIFDHISGISACGYDIQSRVYNEIIEEIASYTKLYLSRVSDQLIIDLMNGYSSC